MQDPLYPPTFINLIQATGLDGCNEQSVKVEKGACKALNVRVPKELFTRTVLQIPVHMLAYFHTIPASCCVHTILKHLSPSPGCSGSTARKGAEQQGKTLGRLPRVLQQAALLHLHHWPSS